MSLAFITWDINPEIFNLGPVAPRWYGLLFATGFLLGYFITEWVFKRENLNVKWLDTLLLFLVGGTIIGARLGHVLFYEPHMILEDPLTVFKVWKGGLASHGGVIGVFIALMIWSKRVSKQPLWWISDRLAAQISLAAFFIRSGNLMNSEIVGKPTDLPWGFKFMRYYEEGGQHVARHPAQLYEALAYLAIAGILFYFYKKGYAKTRPGFLTGGLFAFIFIARFFIEFIKENQVAFEEGMAMNMGQLLSIPIIVFGLYLMFRKKKTPETN